MGRREISYSKKLLEHFAIAANVIRSKQRNVSLRSWIDLASFLVRSIDLNPDWNGSWRIDNVFSIAFMEAMKMNSETENSDDCQSLLSKLLLLESDAWTKFRKRRPSNLSSDMEMSLELNSAETLNFDNISAALRKASTLCNSGALDASAKIILTLRESSTIKESTELMNQLILIEFLILFFK